MMAIQDNAQQSYLGMSEANLQKSVQALQVILANSLFMFQLYKKYHWHVAGTDFYQYHLLFDKHAGEQPYIIDAVAERLRTLGAIAPGMPNDVIANASITENADPGHDAQAMVRSLLACHEAYIVKLRETIDITNENEDEGTSDLLVSDVLRVHELETWFLRSSIQE